MKRYGKSPNRLLVALLVMAGVAHAADTNSDITPYETTPSGHIYVGEEESRGNIGSENDRFTFSDIRDTYNYGAGIENRGTISDIHADFTNNSAIYAGGAIWNLHGTINRIDGTFTGNSANNGKGGAIFNESHGTVGSIINSINGTFTANSSTQGGGAISNSANATIGTINAVFSANTAESTGEWVRGGAIYNEGAILNNISADFKNNTAKSENSFASGGAIANTGTIKGRISGTFSSNSTISAGDIAYGGAISNIGNAAIGLIENTAFEGNHAHSGSNIAYGGAILNQSQSTIGGIRNTSFNNNRVTNDTDYHENAYIRGGAISNWGSITYISARFEGNYAEAATDMASGGAIANEGSIGTNDNTAADNGILGDFIKNTAISHGSTAYGGAISNIDNASISAISGSFENNRTYTSFTDAEGTNKNGVAKGGAIFNQGKITSINSSFTGNAAESEGTEKDYASTEDPGTSDRKASREAYGGAIYNNINAEIGSITGTFESNLAHSREDIQHSKVNTAHSGGGAIANEGTINSLTASFTGNAASSDGDNGYRTTGGAIRNFDTGKIGYISGLFQNNLAHSQGERIYKTNGELAQMSLAYGGAINSSGTIDKIADSEFTGNMSVSNEGHAFGGAIYNYAQGTIKTIENVVFTNNSASSVDEELGDADKGDSAHGGAIGNSNNATIETIRNATFTGNSVEGYVTAYGGAIYNQGLYFDNQGQTGTNENLHGVIGSINGTFTNNRAHTSHEYAYGGAIYNAGTIGTINGEFTGNTAQADGEQYERSNPSSAHGGAIANTFQGEIGTITGIFTENTVRSFDIAYGGAIWNGNTVYTEYIGVNAIGEIRADFIRNSVVSETGKAIGGAIWNDSRIGTIEGKFLENSVIALGRANPYETAADDPPNAAGGAIRNKGNIDRISGTFSGNSAITYATARAQGGAISDDSGEETADTTSTMDIEDSVFMYNYTESRGYGVSRGGAISNESGELIFKGETVFYDNRVYYDGKYGTYKNDIHNESQSMRLAEGGTMWLDGGITGTGRFLIESDAKLYIDSIGTPFDLQKPETGSLTLIENDTDNNGTLFAGNGQRLFIGKKNDLDVHGTLAALPSGTPVSLNLNSGSSLYLGKGARIGVTGSYTSDNPDLWIRMGFDSQNAPVTGLITVDGDVKGHSSVIVSAENAADPSRDYVRFLEAPKDDLKTDASFKVTRVYASPYMWQAKGHTGTDGHTGETLTGSRWYLEIMRNTPNENQDKDTTDWDPERPHIPGPHPEPEFPDIYTPEIGAEAAMHQIAFQQTRSINQNVWRGISFEYDPHCQQKTCTGGEKTRRNAWVQANYESGRIKTPAVFDARVNGLTLGVDFYHDNEQRAGVFGAYRNGDYDLNGHSKYHSTLGSKVEDESWLGGLYYKYDDRTWMLFSTLYAGRQKLDLRTDDRIVRADTSAWQYGLNAKLGRRYWHDGNRMNIMPFIGASYQILDIKDFSDNAGKTAKMDVLHYGSAELGAKFEYVYCRGDETVRYYIQPSVLRSFSEGGRTWITGIDKTIKTFDDRTMGRTDIGGEWSFHNDWSAFVNAGYAFGGNYHAYDVNAGLSWHF